MELTRSFECFSGQVQTLRYIQDKHLWLAMRSEATNGGADEIRTRDPRVANAVL